MVPFKVRKKPVLTAGFMVAKLTKICEYRKFPTQKNSIRRQPDDLPSGDLTAHFIYANYAAFTYMYPRCGFLSIINGIS